MSTSSKLVHLLCCLAFTFQLCAGSRGATYQTAGDLKSNKSIFTFTWGTEAVGVMGAKRWVSEDTSEKSIDLFDIAIVCTKKLRICIKTEVDPDQRRMHLEALSITQWDGKQQQINANGEHSNDNPCQKDSYILNGQDSSVLLITNPGPSSGTPFCIQLMGKPKTTIYRLSE